MSTAPDGTSYRDLNGNGVLDPFENPALPTAQRVADLLPRLSLAEKVGLMFQPAVPVGPGGALVEEPVGAFHTTTSELIGDRLISHINVASSSSPRDIARWQNRVQALAERTPHGIPVTISTDPRHSFLKTRGVSFAAEGFSRWPEPLGLGAIGDIDLVRSFADTVRREYRAVGIRSALHPQIDLATEPRWGRQVQTFGSDVAFVSAVAEAYVRGLQGDRLNPTSVAATTKHFPGGGPQKDGEDPHFPYGREQVYPGGAFEDHLRPFRAAIGAGTANMMPYYGMPLGLELDGAAVEEVGFGFNRQVLTSLLRERLGFTGVVVTDWGLVHDDHEDGRVLPARAWGVEHLSALDRVRLVIDAGADQFGGEACADLVLALVGARALSVERIDRSAERLLTVKFDLGLFDDPYVDEGAVAASVGRAEDVRAGEIAQSRSVTLLLDQLGRLPLRRGLRVYTEGMDRAAVDGFGVAVDDPADADVAIVRLDAPFEPRDELYFERSFHAGSLDFDPAVLERLEQLGRSVPLLIDVFLERPAIVTPLLEFATVLTGSFGTSDTAYLRAVFGDVAPEGRLPFDLPKSADAVAASRPDVRLDEVDAVFRAGHGLALATSARGDRRADSTD